MIHTVDFTPSSWVLLRILILIIALGKPGLAEKIAGFPELSLGDGNTRMAVPEFLGYSASFAREQKFSSATLLGDRVLAVMQGHAGLSPVDVAQALKLADRAQEAASEYEKAAKSSGDAQPALKSSFLFQAGILYGKTNPDRARQLLAAAAMTYPSDPRVPLELARLSFKLGKLDEVGILLECAEAGSKELAPYRGYVAHQASLILYAMGREEEVLAWVQRLPADTAAPAALDVGQLLRAMRRFDDALVWLKRAAASKNNELARRAWKLYRVCNRLAEKKESVPKQKRANGQESLLLKYSGISECELLFLDEFTAGPHKVLSFICGAPGSERSPLLLYVVRPSQSADDWGKPTGRYELTPTLQSDSLGRSVYALESIFIKKGHQTHALFGGLPTEAQVRAVVADSLKR